MMCLSTLADGERGEIRGAWIPCWRKSRQYAGYRGNATPGEYVEEIIKRLCEKV